LPRRRGLAGAEGQVGAAGAVVGVDLAVEVLAGSEEDCPEDWVVKKEASMGVVQ